MARPIILIQNGLSADLVAAAASLGITINPQDWVSVPGNLSETDYKLLLLNTVASGIGFEEQQYDLFLSQQEALISAAQPQTLGWFQYQFLNMQYNSTTPILPQIQPSTGVNPLSVIWSQPANPANLPIAFCIAQEGYSGQCLIKIASSSNGLPVPVSSGVLASAVSFSNLIAAPGISYVVSSAKSDWLFLQLDVYYNGAYSAIIFASVQTAITNFLNSLSTTAFNSNLSATMKLSALENAILSVTGVNDVEFINVAVRPDITSAGLPTWGTSYQEYLVSNGAIWNTSTGWSGGLNPTENAKSWSSIAGYISLENNTSTGGSINFSQLSDFRTGTSGILNLNCIAV